MVKLANYFPILDWGRSYRSETFINDGIAAVIVTILLIPQALAYALLAGLPPQIGLYASILPLVAYAVFGTSRSLAVGPVAIISLMTAVAAGQIAVQGSPEYLAVVVLLALISGIMLIVMGLLRMGFIANFLSHPVISGFITASVILIAIGQLKHILGVEASGDNVLELILALTASISETNLPTVAIGVGSAAFLLWSRKGCMSLLLRLGLQKRMALIGTKISPVIMVALSILVVFFMGLTDDGVKVVGDIPKGLPSLAVPAFDFALWRSLLVSSLIIAIIGFVENISVAQTFAAKRRQRIDTNQELIGLGSANIAAAFSGAYPVAGSFGRSAVNFDAGAQTPAAGAFTAVGIALVSLFLTPLLYFLPIATLAATIIVSVLSLVDIAALKKAWAYSKTDFAAMMATIVLIFTVGVEAGIVAGVMTSVGMHLFRSSRPHFAIVGQVPGTDHFRNIKRHEVEIHPNILTIRIDESLYFANARFMEDAIYGLVLDAPKIEHVILMCSAVNDIDLSALDSLEAINQRLEIANIKFHLSEVKGPVMDKLKRCELLNDLTGQVFLSQVDAINNTSGKHSA